MSKKTIGILVFAALALGVAGVVAYPTLTPVTVVGVSKVKAAPAQYLGKVTITGLTGNTYPAQGVVEIVDEKACCNLFLFVPSTEAQKAELKAEGGLFSGTLPTRGQALEAHGVLRQTKDGFVFDVTRVTSDGTEIIRRL